MTKLCVKIHMKSNSAIYSAFPWTLLEMTIWNLLHLTYGAILLSRRTH